MTNLRWPRFSPLTLALVCAGCSYAPPTAREDMPPSAHGRRVIDERAIEQSGARTVWDALQRTVPFFVFHTNSHGRPTRVEHRGRSSIVLSDQPLILVDGVEIKDFAALGDMPASEVLDIEVLTGVDATTQYGTNATNGVIRIRSKVGKS